MHGIFRSILTSLFFLGSVGSADPTFAGVTAGSDFASQEYKKWCEKKMGAGDFCTLMALFIDPVGEGISEFSIALEYDPSDWTFRDDKSGFMCEFSDGGYCEPANAGYGKRPVGSIYEPVFGPPASGSTFELTQPSDGFISLSATFGSPIEVSEDTNMFAFVFEPVSFDLNQPFVATYYSDTTSGSIRQASWSCSTNLGAACGSNTPIGSSTVAPIPLPPSLAMFGLGLAALSLTTKGRKKS